jgi:hypothetical protein
MKAKRAAIAARFTVFIEATALCALILLLAFAEMTGSFARAMMLFAKPKISRRRKERRSGWPAKYSPTNSCAYRLRLEARPYSDQRMPANRSS